MFVILPIVGAVIGYTTKWVSVQLIFKPPGYVGVGPIGWQGVVQRRSPKFAAGVAEMLGDVAPLGEILERVDPAGLVDELTDSLRPVIAELMPSGRRSRSAPGSGTSIPRGPRDDHLHAGGGDPTRRRSRSSRNPYRCSADDLDITPMVIESALRGERRSSGAPGADDRGRPAPDRHPLRRGGRVLRRTHRGGRVPDVRTLVAAAARSARSTAW